MQDAANDTQAAGQPDHHGGENAAAQQMLADAIAQTEPEPQDGTGQATSDNPWADPDAARREIERLRRQAAGYRTKLRDAEPKLAEYQKHLDSQKTEQQKLAEAKHAAEAELAELRSTNARLVAAATHNIPADLIDLLGVGTEEEIDARARLLAAKLTMSAREDEHKPPTSRRPVESLTPGARPADAAPTDMDAILRRMAGRTP